MSFLIPTAKRRPTLLGRFGRLVYWIALGFAALLMILACMAALAHAPPPRPDGLPAAQDLAPGAFVFWAVCVALVGRAVRYLFAGE